MYNYTEGQKMGELTFLKRAESKPGVPMGVFLCKCGKEFITRINGVISEHTKSCGCSRSTPRNIYTPGQEIGTCVYLERMPTKKGHSGRAKFRCHCGKEFITAIQRIIDGETKSCGCMTKMFLSQGGNNPRNKIPDFSEEEYIRFWSKVTLTVNPDKCWNWTGTGQRYGHFGLDNKSYKSNRIAYFLTHKQDPGELEVIHSCDNPKCCNPNHLSLGTHWDNMQDMVEKGRSGERQHKKRNNINSQ